MKKVFFALAALAVLGLGSCKKKSCITCAGVKVCEDNYTSTGGVSWEDYRGTMVSTGACSE